MLPGVSLQDEHEWREAGRFEIIRDSGYMILPLGEAVARLRGGTLQVAVL